MGEIPAAKHTLNSLACRIETAAFDGNVFSDNEIVLVALPEIPGARPFEPLLILKFAAHANRRHVIWKSERFIFPANEELFEIISTDSEKKRELVLAAAVDWKTRSVKVVRGDLSQLSVSFDAFAPAPTGVNPVFENLAIIDFGQTIQFGDYEASADSLSNELESQMAACSV